MPIQKHKLASTKKVGRKHSSSVFGDVPIKGGGNLPKIESISFAEIEKAAARFGKELEAKILPVDFKNSRCEVEVESAADGVVIRLILPLLSGSEAIAAPRLFDPVDAGRTLVLRMQQAEGGAWTGAELDRQFELSSSALHKRRSEFRIVWWKDAKSQFHYPKWQFDQAGALLGGVQEVLQTFRSSDQWRVMRYFLTPWHQLGDRRPLDWLRQGQVEKVVAHAKAHGEENSW